MKINQFEIWIADLNPKFGTESGKIRPVVIVQTDLLNNIHPSTLICPLTTNIKSKTNLLRVHLKSGMSNLKEDCDVLVDQLRSIDNKRLINKIGKMPDTQISILKENIKIILDLIE